MKKRIFSLILVLLMTAPSVVSCSQSSENAAQDKQESEESIITADNAVVEETEPARLECNVPDDLDLQGETIGVLTFESATPDYIGVTEANGETLNDAAFAANIKVMDELNFSFEVIPNGGIEPVNLNKAITAGDDIYDIVYGTQWKVAPLVSRHIFANLNRSEDNYIDFDAPWWYNNYIHETEAGVDNTFFLAGDASPDIIRRSSMMILDIDLLTDVGKDVNDVYDTVIGGNWTYDEMNDLAASLYIDENGDGQKGAEDTFGYVSWTRSDIDHFTVDAGVRGCTKDENGIPYISFNNEVTVKFVEEHCKFLWENEGVYYVEGAPTFDMLEDNRVLLLSEKFSRLDLIRDVETKFTVIPMPKLDDTIESYSSLVHDDAIIISIPIINTNLKNHTAVLEKLCYNYYYDLMPQYYEVILKNKYRRDSSDAASQILDIIHDSMTTDFAYIYNYALSNMMLSLRDSIGVTKSSSFASEFQRRERIYTKAFDKLIGALEG